MKSRKTRTQYSILNIFAGVGATGVETVLRFVSRTVFIKFFSIEYLGVNSLFTEILSVLSLAELGVGSAIVFALFKPLATRDNEKIASLMRFYKKCYVSIGCATIGIGLAIMPFLKYIVNTPDNISINIYLVYLIFLLNTAVSYFYSYKTSLMTADQRGYILQAFRSINILITTGLQIVIIVVTRNYYLYILIQLITTIAFNIISSTYATHQYPILKQKKVKKLDKTTFKSLVVNIRALVVIRVSSILVNSTDNMIISVLKGIKSVGLLSNYNLFVSVVNTFLAKVFDSINSSIGNLNAEGNLEKSKKFFNSLVMMNFWLYSFSGIALYILSNDIITLWIGKQYLLSSNIVLIIVINLYVLGMQNAVWNYKNTFGLFRYGRYLLVLTAVINVLLSFILGKYMGIAGVLVATTISRIVTNVWYEPYAVFKYGLKAKVRTYYFKYVEYLILYILLLVLTRYISELHSVIHINNTFAIIIYKVICLLLIPNTIFVCLFIRNESFKYIVRIIKGAVKK